MRAPRELLKLTQADMGGHCALHLERRSNALLASYIEYEEGRSPTSSQRTYSR